jgi:hypothetical protein
MMHTRIFAAFLDGARRVRQAPAILVSLLALSLVAALLPGIVIHEQIAAGLGSSAEADTMVNGVSLDWMDLFGESASGLSRTVSPAVIGFAAPIENLSRVADVAGALPPAVIGLVVAYVLLWLFLSGGMLDRYARQRALRSRAFFGACGMLFPRFLRLGLVALVGYGLLFGVIHAWLFGNVWTSVTREMTVERTAFFLRLALYLVFGVLLAAWNVVLDYARIRTVVEDRRSAIGALWSACRFVAAKPRAVASLYALNAGCFVVALGIYGMVAPGAAGGGVSAWTAFAIGQLFILVRIGLKLTFYASQTALFQQSFAHAAYAAPPQPLWPDSPAAEAIARGADRAQ